MIPLAISVFGVVQALLCVVDWIFSHLLMWQAYQVATPEERRDPEPLFARMQGSRLGKVALIAYALAWWWWLIPVYLWWRYRKRGNREH